MPLLGTILTGSTAHIELFADFVCQVRRDGAAVFRVGDHDTRHARSGHLGHRVGDVGFDLGGGPGDVRRGHRIGVGEVFEATCRPAYHAMKVGPDPGALASVQAVARCAIGVESGRTGGRQVNSRRSCRRIGCRHRFTRFAYDNLFSRALWFGRRGCR